MKKHTQLFIATKRGNKYYYIAKPSDDGTSIIIQRVTRLGDDPKTAPKEYRTLISIIDCDDYVFTAIEIGDMQYSVSSKIPSAEYESDIPDEYEKYREYVVEVETPHNSLLRVHLDTFDEDEDVFNRFTVTRVQGNSELNVAYIDIDEDNELGVSLSGYPAGYEISENF